MHIQSNVRHKVIISLVVIIFTAASFSLSNFAFADKGKGRGGDRNRIERHGSDRDDRDRSKSRHRVVSPRVIRKDHVVSRLPRGYRRIWHDRNPYYYYSGIFYRPFTSGFITVSAPLGAIVVSLPVGYQRVRVDDSLYYAYGSSFYRKVPSGYKVVEAPSKVIVEDNVPEIVAPPEPANGNVAVTTTVLNVRSGPGLDYPLIYQMHEGYVLEIHGKTLGWLYVILPNGEYGWVMSIYTSPLAGGSG